MTAFRGKKEEITIKPTSYNLTQRCQELLLELNIIYREKQAEYKLDITEDIIINVDPLYFEMALRNLLDNAFKYSSSPAKLTVAIMRKRKKIYICITDYGKGIPKKEQKKIFREFLPF